MALDVKQCQKWLLFKNIVTKSRIFSLWVNIVSLRFFFYDSSERGNLGENYWMLLVKSIIINGWRLDGYNEIWTRILELWVINLTNINLPLGCESNMMTGRKMNSLRYVEFVLRFFCHKHHSEKRPFRPKRNSSQYGCL